MSEKLHFVAELKRRNIYTHYSFRFADTLRMETIAAECGFGNINSMRTVFERALKIALRVAVAAATWFARPRKRTFSRLHFVWGAQVASLITAVRLGLSAASRNELFCLPPRRSLG
jgi:hypothetical protein